MERREPAHFARDSGPDGVESVERAEPAVALGPLTELFGFMLRLAQLQVFGVFFSEFGERGIRPGQISILIAIGANPGVRQGALANALSIKRSNMAKIVRLLEKERLIARRVPASDRRSVELRLTSAGQAFVEAALPDIRVNDRVATAMLSGSERKALMGILHKLTGIGDAGAHA
jgi:DNA-binding MarR family transcriptional regulator